MTDREPLALECALLSAQASGVAGGEDTLRALGLLRGRSAQGLPPVSCSLPTCMPCRCLRRSMVRTMVCLRGAVCMSLC